jgi:hypothetical protein
VAASHYGVTFAAYAAEAFWEQMNSVTTAAIGDAALVVRFNNLFWDDLGVGIIRMPHLHSIFIQST